MKSNPSEIDTRTTLVLEQQLQKQLSEDKSLLSNAKSGRATAAAHKETMYFSKEELK